ncbi:MAG: exonuclease SbcCD subunit D C-terminal domain-containing protein [Candidatus Competibacteraceae bacterium]|jgi:exonuclease SbcD|nr:exonuclease SbcCD subunit D C-terminal domain-containing protein [Candidatus Competibacteraceae bacterium]
MRLFHTADWHLGQTLHGISREYEHRCFLDWLLDTLVEHQADALLIAGDVFDSANPPATAQALFYHFIAAAKRRCASLDIVVVGGNHDSPARLEAPQPLLTHLGVHLVGTLPRQLDRHSDLQRIIVPLHNRHGEIAAWCAAVPFLRPVDLPSIDSDTADPLVEGVTQVYRQVLTTLRERLTPNQALLATGHCYMVGTQLSELSERKILGGNQHALPVGIFPADLTYGALGHLHLAQAVGKQEHIRYSGSPIPLSLAEEHYPHQIVQVDFSAGQCQAITALPVPRSVEIIRLPTQPPLPLEAVEKQLNALDLAPLPPERQPFLEVTVLLDQPEPSLRHRIDHCLASKPVRLLKIASHYTGTEQSLADSVPEIHLQELTPDEVFIRRYRQHHADEPSSALLNAFHQLLESVQGAPPEHWDSSA